MQKLNMKSILQIWVLFCLIFGAIGLIMQWRLVLGILFFGIFCFVFGLACELAWEGLNKIRNWFKDKNHK